MQGIFIMGGILPPKYIRKFTLSVIGQIQSALE